MELTTVDSATKTLHCGHLGIMKKKMETIIMGHIGYRVWVDSTTKTGTPKEGYIGVTLGIWGKWTRKWRLQGLCRGYIVIISGYIGLIWG